MPFVKHSAAFAAIIAAVVASPAPQNLDFAALDAAPTVASGPSIIPDVDGVETASLLSSVTITGVATAATTGVAKRDDAYTPYYPALATGYTTDPALTKTATAPGACATQPEAGMWESWQSMRRRVAADLVLCCLDQAPTAASSTH